MKRLLAGALACGMLTVLVACDPKVSGDGPICIWGDSITQQSTDELVQHTQVRDAGYELLVADAIGGYGFNNWDYWQPRIANVLATMKDGKCAAHIVALGTNDYGHTYTPLEITTMVGRFFDALGTQPIVYVMPNRHSTRGTETSRLMWAETVNTLAATRSNVHVLDLSDEMTRADYDSDGEVHLSPQGQAHWADRVEDKLDELFPPDPNEFTEL